MGGVLEQREIHIKKLNAILRAKAEHESTNEKRSVGKAANKRGF